MSLLLDTHTLLWFVVGDERMRPEVRALIADPEVEVYVSAASAWEVATKVRLGTLPGAEFLAQDFAEEIQRQGFFSRSPSRWSTGSARAVFPVRTRTPSIAC